MAPFHLKRNYFFSRFQCFLARETQFGFVQCVLEILILNFFFFCIFINLFFFVVLLQVIKVQDAHPQAFKRFVPSCVVLHRCDRESGCCDDVDNVCSAVLKERISAYFYVVSLGEQNGVTSVEVDGRVERLRFVNHTLCGCRRRRRLSLTSDLDSVTPDERAVTGGQDIIGKRPQVVVLMLALLTVTRRLASWSTSL